MDVSNGVMIYPYSRNESNYNMQPITIQFAVRLLRIGYVRTIRISRENNMIQIDLPDGSIKVCPLHDYLSDVWDTRCLTSAESLNSFLNKIDKIDSKIGFEMSLIVVEAICRRCASFRILTATISEIFGWADKLI